MKFKLGDKVKLVNIPDTLAGHIHNGKIVELVLKSYYVGGILSWVITPELIDPHKEKPYTSIEECFMELVVD